MEKNKMEKDEDKHNALKQELRPVRMFSDSSLGLVYPTTRFEGRVFLCQEGIELDLVVLDVDLTQPLEEVVSTLYTMGQIAMMSAFNSVCLARGRKASTKFPVALFIERDWEGILEPYGGKLEPFFKRMGVLMKKGSRRVKTVGGPYRQPTPVELALFDDYDDMYACEFSMVAPPPPDLMFLDILDKIKGCTKGEAITYVLEAACQARRARSQYYGTGGDPKTFDYGRSVLWKPYVLVADYFPPPQVLLQVKDCKNPFQNVGYHVTTDYERLATPEEDSAVIVEEIKRQSPRVVFEPFSGFGSDTCHLVGLQVSELEVSDVDPVRIGFCYMNAQHMAHKPDMVYYYARKFSDAFDAARQEVRHTLLYLDPPWDTVVADDEGSNDIVVDGVGIREAIAHHLLLGFVIKVPIYFQTVGWRRPPTRVRLCPSGKMKILSFASSAYLGT